MPRKNDWNVNLGFGLDPRVTANNILGLLSDQIMETEKEQQDAMSWTRYTDPDPVRWIQSHFYIPELNTPMPVYPSQENPLREALSRDENGLFRYSTVVWSAIKKSAKSSIAAAVGLWFAWQKPWSSIKIIANDLKQADSRVAYYMRRAVQLHHEWGQVCKVINYRIELPNHSTIEAIPIDPKGEAGGNDDLVIYSEIWAWQNKASMQLWTESTLSPMKYGRSLRWAETYAGISGESPILEQLYDQGVKNGRVVDAEYEMYANDAARLFVLWNTKPGLPWQTREYYCLPLPSKKEDLMVLTEGGWKSAEDISLADRLCTRNKSGVIEYQNPTGVFREKYDGELLRLKHARTNLVMTPNHRIFGAFASHTRKVKGMLDDGLKFEYKAAEDAMKMQIGWIPGIGDWNHSDLERVCVENEVYSGDDFAEFLAWYLSEGNMCVDNRNRKPYYSMLAISQDRDKNVAYCSEIRSLLFRMGLRFTQTKSSFKIFNSRLARYVVQFGKSHEKSIPRFILESCSKRQLQLFFDTYAKGDGTKLKQGGAIVIYTNSDQMALDLMELGLKAGYRPKFNGSYSSAPEKGRRPIHHLRFMKCHIGWSFGDHRKPWSREQAPENCEVWCPTVPNGNFYVMQNKTCYWSGNSQEEAVLTPREFKRVHRNQWVSSEDIFVPIEWWDACKVDEFPPMEKDDPCIIAMDAAVSGDTFGVAMVSGREGDDFDVRLSRAWKPPLGGKIDFSKPEEYVRELIAQYNVLEICYDPFQLEDMAGRMKKELIARLHPFNQGKDRTIADKGLYDKIRRKLVHHDGNKILREHVENANQTGDSDRLRIVKRAELLKIDLCVCVSMAVYRAAYWRL